MDTFEVLADVPEDRHVVIVLPLSVPTGKARLKVSVEAETTDKPKPPRSSLAKWAEANAKPRESSLADWVAQCAEHMGTATDSTDVEGFTGRRY